MADRQPDRSHPENDILRARFTSWLNMTLIRARQRFLEKEKQQLELVSIEHVSEDELVDPQDCYYQAEHSKSDFDFEEETLSRAFTNYL